MMAPNKIGTYSILSQIAIGGMAEIYLAKQENVYNIWRKVAIKRITKKLWGDQEVENMFCNEARVHSLLSHPNIVQFYEFGEDKESYFIAMEYVDGISLRQFIDAMIANKTPIPLEYCLQITAQILAGLQHAHEQADSTGTSLGLVHRDITPVNILLSRDGYVKVCDFGVVKSTLNQTLTQVGVIKGKFRYMSPEQIDGDILDARTDIFSCGTILWEMLTGKRLFDQQSDGHIAQAIRSGIYPKPSSIRNDLPTGVDIVVRKSLAPTRQKRYSSAREFQQDCELLLKQLPYNHKQPHFSVYLAAQLDHKRLPHQQGELSPAGNKTPSFPSLSKTNPIMSMPAAEQSYETSQYTAAPAETTEATERIALPSRWGKWVSRGILLPAQVFAGLTFIGNRLLIPLQKFQYSLRSKQHNWPEVRLTRTTSRQ